MQLGPTSRSARAVRTLVILGAVVALTATAHLVFLGWHRLQEYESWKVTTYAVTLAIVVAAAAWLRAAVAGATALPVAVTVLWCFDAATDTGGDGADLWPVGGMFVLVGAAAGATVVASITVAARAACHRHVA